MKYYTIVLWIFPLFLISCSKAPIKKEFSRLQKNIKNRTDSFLVWRDVEELKRHMKLNDETAQSGLSRKAAHALTLYNNTELQVALESIGIAKADLVQAGFFTNPRIESIFHIPTTCNDKATTNIEIDVTLFTLSDLWQVPIKKDLADDELKIKTEEIVELVLSLIKDVNTTYDNCILQQELLAHTTSLITKIRTLLKQIKIRQESGYETNFNYAQAQIQLGEWEMHYAQQKANLFNAFLSFTHLLGLEPSLKEITLTDTYLHKNKSNIIFKEIEKQALEINPRIHLAHLSLAQAEHELSMARAKVLDDVTIGVSYKRDFDTIQGAGPLFGINIPLFDTNSGAIEHAKYKIEQAQKQIRNEQRILIKSLRTTFVEYKALKKQTFIMKKMLLPAHDTSLAYAQKYSNTMQTNMLLLFNAEIHAIETHMKHTKIVHDTAVAYAQLEQILGKTLS